ncbi:MAG: SIMPL domain-containing protein [Candidatus Gastranaerophilales bacterium]|nr:SIMPL domain-containing protein [Candidatus Gastranaerophilales bacterium]
MDKLEKYQLFFACGVIALGIFASSLVFANRISKDENITVTGSASKIVKSDSAKVRIELSARETTQKTAYTVIKSQTPVVIKYLEAKGIDKKDINTRTINGYYNYKTNSNGYSTNEIASYSANQSIEVSSKDVEKIKEISTDIQSLVDKGIDLSVDMPEYYYSDLASIKIELLKDAALDAKQRAQSMLSAANSSVGKVKSMKMGVFQITAPDSTNVSDYGINDTSTIDKKVTAVANVVFKVK